MTGKKTPKNDNAQHSRNTGSLHAKIAKQMC